MVTTRKQREAVWRLFNRAYDVSYESPRQIRSRYRQFRRTVRWCGPRGGMYLGVNLWHMFIGIEADGYTHT